MILLMYAYSSYTIIHYHAYHDPDEKTIGDYVHGDLATAMMSFPW